MNPEYRGEDKVGNRFGLFHYVDDKSDRGLDMITFGKREGTEIGSNCLKIGSTSVSLLIKERQKHPVGWFYKLNPVYI